MSLFGTTNFCWVPNCCLFGKVGHCRLSNIYGSTHSSGCALSIAHLWHYLARGQNGKGLVLGGHNPLDCFHTVWKYFHDGPVIASAHHYRVFLHIGHQDAPKTHHHVELMGVKSRTNYISLFVFQRFAGILASRKSVTCPKPSILPYPGHHGPLFTLGTKMA